MTLGVEVAATGDLLSQAKTLISELRNRRNPDVNWMTFKEFVELNQVEIISSFSSRWLISICDTYADYAGEVQRRNAFLISVLFNLIRLSDTLYEAEDIRTERVAAIKAGQLPLFDGFQTLHLDKQDTLLNLAKRLSRLLRSDNLFHAIFKELLSRALRNDNLLTRFAAKSERPEWVFPEEALEIPDNYGVR